jgi:hypothetical protein
MSRAEDMERAQAEAVMLAAAKGITDPVKVRLRKHAARRALKRRWQDEDTIARVKAEDASRGNG